MWEANRGIQHFFFLTIRANLINTVQAVINIELSAELLLLGSYNLSVEQNLTIMDAFHLFAQQI